MDLRSEILKDFKKAVYEANDERFERGYYPCGLPGVDKALKGGMIKGAMMEIYGPWSSAKTVLMSVFLAANQKRGGTSILYLSEGKAAFDPDWFQRLGGQLDGPNGLLIFPVKTIEDVFTKTWKILDKVHAKMLKGEESPQLMFGWDSIAATGSAKLFDTGMDKVDMTKAKAISEGCKLITTLLSETDSAFIAVNQERANIGDSEYAAKNTAGGKGWKYHASQRIELDFDGGEGSSRPKTEGGAVIGRKIRGRVIKNRGAGPEGRFKFTVYSDGGHPHPVFEGLTVEPGIDIPQCVWEYYVSDGAIFGPDKEKLLVSSGPTWRLHDKVVEWTGEPNKGFYKKKWPTILAKHPQLMEAHYDPFNLCTSCNQYSPLPGESVCPHCADGV